MKKISLKQVVQIALEHYRLKQYKQVTQILQPLIQHGVQDNDIYLLIGNAYHCLGQYQMAIRAYLGGLHIDPDSADLYVNLGNAYIQRGSYYDAIDSYNSAIAIESNDIAVHRNLMYAYSATRQTQNAIQKCDEILLAVGLPPNNLDIALESQYHRQNPSPVYLSLIDMYNKLHVNGDSENKIDSQKMYAGGSILPWISTIKKLITLTDSQTLLDYGSGKGLQYKDLLLEDKDQLKYRGLQDYWEVDAIYCYDPAYLPYQKLPQKQYDAVISTDVMEHCHQEDIKWIIDEIFSLAGKFVFINIACYQAGKSLPNGENAHCIIGPAVWWDQIFQLVVSSYPRVKYCILLEYLWTDVEGEKRMFDIRSNFDSVRIELDPSAITILEADGNLVPVHLLPMEIPSYVADMAE
jgi:tetratricopeptide (TPR) repeat protein